MSSDIQHLLALMARLRDRKNGCPWDVQQTFATIAPFTIEEAYEVADAIDRGDMNGLAGELGDLLFQVVFHSQMAKELGHFDFDAVVRAITDKMTHRHPHVFGGAPVDSAAAQTRRWEALKAREREQQGDGKSLMDGIARNLPALQRADKLQRRAAQVGFDWSDGRAVLDKLREELREVEREVTGEGARSRIAEELGDLLFTCINLARHERVDAESALRLANRKFERRFRHVEALARQHGVRLAECSPAQLDALWEQAKSETR